MSRRLNRMRSNPHGGWRVADVVSVCREFGMLYAGSRVEDGYCSVAHPSIPDILTLPSVEELKPVYIRKLVRMIDDAQPPAATA